MKCPYCGSKATHENNYTQNYNGQLKKSRTCFNCGRDFEEREVKDCGNKTFYHGDNFPNFKIERDKFKDLGIVPKAKEEDKIDLWIDLWQLLRDKTRKN